MRGSVAMVRPMGTADDDHALVQAWLDGDVDAFDELYQRYLPQLVRLLRGRTDSLAAAEDLAQETMVRAMARLADFEPRGPLWPWLRRIAVNAAVDAARARGRADALAAHLVSAPETARVADPADRLLEERDVLTRALAEVPARQRAALERCYLQGWRPSDVAAEFGVGTNAFDQLLHRARRNLRAAYHRHDDRAAHLGWLLSPLGHLEGVIMRLRQMAVTIPRLGEAAPRLGEAAVAAVSAGALAFGVAPAAVHDPPAPSPVIAPVASVHQILPAQPPEGPAGPDVPADTAAAGMVERPSSGEGATASDRPAAVVPHRRPDAPPPKDAPPPGDTPADPTRRPGSDGVSDLLQDAVGQGSAGPQTPPDRVESDASGESDRPATASAQIEVELGPTGPGPMTMAPEPTDGVLPGG